MISMSYKTLPYQTRRTYNSRVMKGIKINVYKRFYFQELKNI